MSNMQKIKVNQQGGSFHHKELSEQKDAKLEESNVGDMMDVI